MTPQTLGFSLSWRVERREMTRTELIIQLLKVAIGLAAYFVGGVYNY
jgi:hypothetical protein